MNSKLTYKKYKQIKKLFYKVAKLANVSKKEIEEILNPLKPNNSNFIFENLCRSLQNSGRLSNVINFKENYNDIKNDFFDFDINKVIGAYCKGNTNDITCILSNHNTNPDSWNNYYNNAINGAKYLNNSNNLIKIKELIQNKANDIDYVIKEIEDIATNISGLGIALTCDWLKECGATYLVKPDTHIINVYYHLIGETMPDTVNDFMKKTIIKDMYLRTQDIKKKDKSITSYKLDKMIWLISTGNFIHVINQPVEI